MLKSNLIMVDGKLYLMKYRGERNIVESVANANDRSGVILRDDDFYAYFTEEKIEQVFKNDVVAWIKEKP